MSSQRYTTPNNTPESDFDGGPLILKFEQDPRDITIINPTPEQLATALTHINAALHPEVLEMAEEAVRQDTPLNEKRVFLAAEVNRAHIEELVTTGWTTGNPEPIREIRIKRLPPQSEQEEEAREDEIDFQLLLRKTPKGEVEASLTWEVDDMAYNLNELRDRWSRVDTVCKSWGGDIFPWDLSQLTITPPSDEYRDTHYTHKGLRIGAYPAPADVILDYNDGQTPQRDLDDEDSFRSDPNEDADDERSEFALSSDDDEQGRSSADRDDDQDDSPNKSGNFVEPEGHDIVIREPSAAQLARIARLSKLAINREAFEQAISALRSDLEVESRAFASTNADVLENIYFQSKRSYSLKGHLVQERTLAFHDANEENPVAFSIELTSRKNEKAGAPRVVDAWLHWEMLSSDAEVANWQQILAIAKQKPR